MNPAGTPTGETAQATNTEASTTPQGSVAPVIEEAAKPDVNAEAETLRAELSAAKLEADQAKMRANQLENAARDKELAELAESEKYKELAEKLQEEINTRTMAEEAAKSKNESEAFRAEIIKTYPEAVQKAAEALIAKNNTNLSWADVQSWDEAKSVLTEQLDALASVIGEPVDNTSNPTRKIDANNPLTQKDVDFSSLSLEDMRKILPNSNRTY